MKILDFHFNVIQPLNRIQYLPFVVILSCPIKGIFKQSSEYRDYVLIFCGGVFNLKKLRLIVLSLLILGGVLICLNIYCPLLPLNSISRNDVIKQVNKSHEKIVKISEENGYQWYISEMEEESAYKNLKLLMRKKGWYFKKQVDSGFVFQNDQGEIKVSKRTWRMWGKKYIIFYFPKSI